MAARNGSVDPMLRIVSLSEWIAQSGLFTETLADYTLARNTGGDTTAAVKDLAEIMVKGMSYGTPGNLASRSKLDKEALEQLHNMARCRFLPLEDVHEDLKIWHLTLLRRPDRKKINLQYGRIVKREGDGMQFIDGDLLERMGNRDGLGPGGLPGGGFDIGDISGWTPSGGAGGYDPAFPDGKGPGGGNAEDDFDYLNYGSDPRGGKVGGRGPNGEELDADGNVVDAWGVKLGADGKPLRLGEDGKPLDEAALAALEAEEAAAAAAAEKVAAGKAAVAKAAARKAAAKDGAKGKDDGSGKTGEEGEEADEEPEETEEQREAAEIQRLLAAGLMFRVKKLAEEVILDEFEGRMLLPPPSLPSPTGSRPTSQEGGARTRRSLMPQRMPPMSASMRANLAEDFRKCIGDAFRLIDFPDEDTKNKKRQREAAEVEEFLRDDVRDPVMDGLLSKSTAMKIKMKRESSLLHDHLRTRAEKHGRRLQAHVVKGTKDCWPRRLQACRQSLQNISALDSFADLRAREKLAMRATM